VTLFPFLLGLIPADSPHLAAVLEDLHDPEQLWSPFGIRSLSKQDEFYGTGEDYWCSPIWIPINYLALSTLSKVGQV
jgi:mannosyl-oligosaccharide glucosidase